MLPMVGSAVGLREGRIGGHTTAAIGVGITTFGAVLLLAEWMPLLVFPIGAYGL
jgi:hypothetical protein